MPPSLRVLISVTAFLLTTTTRAADPPLTFSHDVAPLVHEHCATCHRPGGAGPFDLLTYQDVRRHLKQIADVLPRRIMPPWLPEPGFGEFAGDRRLDDATLATFQKWIEQGAPEGDPKATPKPPQSTTDWSLGKPDLILKLPHPYILAPDGPDLYRNFVFPPTGLDARRFVRAVEFHAGNVRAVHHAFLFLDRTGTSRRRAETSGSSGYDSMTPGDDAYAPPGPNIAWQPGRDTAVRSDDSPWPLPADADLLLQAHLRRSGKPETLQPELGLYFTETPPAGTYFRLMLRSTSIDIPAGEANYQVMSQYTLPVDVEAMVVSAHAHYLGNDVHAFATMSDGHEVQLLRIKRWNFNMQDVYTFKAPVALPKGTTLHMRYRYDNSAANPANPSSPPKRVYYGDNSTDEMGELALLLRTKSPAERDALEADYAKTYLWPDAVARCENLLKRGPETAELHVELAKLYLTANRGPDVAKHLNAAFKLDPKSAQANYVLAHLLFRQRNYAAAADRYRRCLEQTPEDSRARGDLALTLAQLGKLPEAVEEFQTALRQNPRDSLTHANLGKVYALQGKTAEAKAELEQALRLDPEQPVAREAMNALDGTNKP